MLLLPRKIRRRLASLGSGEQPPPQALGRPQPERTVMWVLPAAAMPPAMEAACAWGAVLSHRLEPSQFGEWASGLVEEALGGPGGQWQALQRGHGVCLLDIETMGLSNERVFLVGLLHVGAGGVHVHQYLARDYSEEPALLELSCRMLAEAEVWVSYNGKSFDVPFIQDRLRYHCMDPLPQPSQHLDLLTTARRRFKKKLPDCKLQTLEEHVFGRARLADIEGARIPDVYREYVSSGQTAEMAVVMQHNVLDLITLLQIAGEFAPDLGPQEK